MFDASQTTIPALHMPMRYLPSGLGMEFHRFSPEYKRGPLGVSKRPLGSTVSPSGTILAKRSSAGEENSHSSWAAAIDTNTKQAYHATN